MCASRRQVLLGLGGVSGVSLLAACSGGGGTPAAPPATGESLAALADVPVGGVIAATTADGAEILIARPTEGEVVAFSAVCTHEGCTVLPEGEGLRCPCHGSEFDAGTGAVLQGPAEEDLPAIAVEVRDGQVVAV